MTGRGSVALNDATQALIAAARKQPELNPQQLFTSFSTSTPQFNYDLDRTKAKLLGLSLPDVFNTLQIYLGSLYVNDFNLFGRTFRVTLQADKDARASAADLSRLLRAQRRRRHGAAEHARRAAADRRARRPFRTTTTMPPLWSTAARRPATARAGGGRDGAGRGRGAAAGFRLRVDGHHLPGAEGGLDRDASSSRWRSSSSS